MSLLGRNFHILYSSDADEPMISRLSSILFMIVPKLFYVSMQSVHISGHMILSKRNFSSEPHMHAGHQNIRIPHNEIMLTT